MVNARILIVEDEGIIATDIQRRLARLGYSVVGTAESGDEAVRMAAQLRPDLVLMDIRLKGDVDGITATDRINRQRQVPVVYLTAHADDEATLHRARQTDPYGYLLKPFQERDLRSVIEIALYKFQAEKRLRESERRYAATLASIGDAVIATDPEARITFMNPVAEFLTGWPVADAMGRPLREIFPIVNEGTRQPVENPVEKVLKEGRVVGLANHTILIGRDGREVPIDDCAAPIWDDADACIGAVLVFRDVTAARRAEAERRRLEEHLRQVTKMEGIGQLAGGIAHDFNNILTIIIGYGQLFLNSLGPDHPWHGLVTEIVRGGERASDLTRQLLAFSRKQMLQPKILDVNQVVTNVGKMLRRLIGEHIELVTELRPQLGTIKADPGQLEQVLVNLAVNARDAMPSGGTLTIATTEVELSEHDVREFPDLRPGAYLRVRVADTGCGMDAAVRARIFEPFFTTKEVGKGTGLGLATVYGIVKQSEGHILVDSAVGCGTTFTIYFPFAHEDPCFLSPAGEASDLPRGSETILVAEDDDAVRSLAGRVLRAAGYTVLEARNGVEALDLSARHTGPIHLLLTDLVMPKLGGQLLVERFGRTRPATKMLCVSGYTEGPLPPGSVDGQVAFLHKPFSPSSLARAVRDVLDG